MVEEEKPKEEEEEEEEEEEKPTTPLKEQEQTPPSPIPTTTPELEQVMIKLQELEQRIGDLELNFANQQGEVGVGTVEKLGKKLKKRKEDITGVPETEKDKEDKKIGPEGTEDVPQAQTSEIDDEAGGKKTGAPVAGEETGLDKGEPAEEDAEKKLPKPSTEYPNIAIQKNALELGTDKGVPSPGEHSEEPEEMEDEEKKKIPQNKSDGFEENYRRVLSGRKSFVGASNSSSLVRNSYLDAKEDTTNTIKEYLRKSKIRI